MEFLLAASVVPRRRKEMNKVFKPIGFSTVPDGTDVSPFLNATDTMEQGVP